MDDSREPDSPNGGAVQIMCDLEKPPASPFLEPLLKAAEIQIAALREASVVDKATIPNILELLVRMTRTVRDLGVEHGQTEDRFRSLLQNLKVGVVAHAPDTTIKISNPMASELLGLTQEQMSGKAAIDPAWHFVDEAGMQMTLDQYPVNRALASPEAVSKLVLGIVRPDREEVTWVQCDAHTIREPDGQPRLVIVTFFDITERKLAEEVRVKLAEQLRASQKMEAIGRLAGGVAHDFNNLLSVILAFTELLTDSMSEEDPRKDDLVEIENAANRAVTLTRQLLAFSRRQVLQPVPLDLNRIAIGVEKMFRRILGEDIDFVLVLAPDLGLTLADPGQIEQVLMNLLVNARDAMPNGGKLTFQTSNLEVEEKDAVSLFGVEPGPYVELAVTDTGDGMDQQTVARVFEPFFSTKDKGTGLGLSTVFGIVKQSSGDIRVVSEPGKGTTFKIVLPRLPATTAPTANGVKTVGSLHRGTETVLVVEDEEALRHVIQRVLSKAGYNVLVAASGEEGLRACELQAGQIQLVLTDVIMPGMNGRKLADQLAKLFPCVKVLFMSGYTDNVIAHHGVLDTGVHFIAKPFTSAALVERVREVLDNTDADLPTH